MKRHGRGLVVLDLELALLPDDDPYLRNPIYHAPTWESFRTLQSVVDGIAAECQPALGEAL